MQGKKWMERICRRYSEILGEQLTGIYLHGSAAFGCACDASDLDFIVVVSGAPSQQQKREMIALLLCLSREPDAPGKGFEMSVVEQTACRPFCYPTPYLLHYSQSYQKQFADTGETPEESLMRKEGQSEVLRALETLSPEHKTAIVLRDIRGFSYEEIAEMTDTALGTVKSRISRARIQLKEEILKIRERKSNDLRQKSRKEGRT